MSEQYEHEYWGGRERRRRGLSAGRAGCADKGPARPIGGLSWAAVLAGSRVLEFGHFTG
jgi:hypothetical protein